MKLKFTHLLLVATALFFINETFALIFVATYSVYFVARSYVAAAISYRIDKISPEHTDYMWTVQLYTIIVYTSPWYWITSNLLALSIALCFYMFTPYIYASIPIGIAILLNIYTQSNTAITK